MDKTTKICRIVVGTEATALVVLFLATLVVNCFVVGTPTNHIEAGLCAILAVSLATLLYTLHHE